MFAKPVSGYVDLSGCSTTLTVNGGVVVLGPVVPIIDLTIAPSAETVCGPFCEIGTVCTSTLGSGFAL